MALEPIAHIRPRRPPVPNGITVQNASSSSFHLPCGDLLGDFSGIFRIARLGEPLADVGGGLGRKLLRSQRVGEVATTWRCGSNDDADGNAHAYRLSNSVDCVGWKISRFSNLRLRSYITATGTRRSLTPSSHDAFTRTDHHRFWTARSRWPIAHAAGCGTLRRRVRRRIAGGACCDFARRTRDRSDAVAAITGALQAMGRKVIDAAVAATPTLEFWCESTRPPAGSRSPPAIILPNTTA